MTKLKLVSINSKNKKKENPLDTRKHEIIIRYNQNTEQVEYDITTNSPIATLVGALMAVIKLLLEGE